ncbi:uncharacterized protein NDAI_0E00680 [Naumovozyma dairenensis CBS 421]|uniref:C2 domain-containing protein n=1 Tax=Naumovozyma dairenensis (strain ATCC 10597 / BCRC 20456 / CBS 421 / NBRC 0211 / NRRL Y-12639) TaxID=1071378 RepID=G0WAW4_NAUDC|nr:hypothetical protein NDAI_0E00680 [Naumovozyma dairenensis CBS 421]CCD24884.1 hypothetical protein NDAI_0E00680 [Naumovozyma dairenensis CBS 421]
MQRISSSSSSILSNINFRDLSSLRPDVQRNDVYWDVLKILLFEYIHEPRFAKEFVQTGVLRETRTPELNSMRNNRLSFIQTDLNVQNTVIDEQAIVRSITPKLESYLRSVIMRKSGNDIQDILLRGSLSKFYNDLYMDPAMNIRLPSMTLEEIIGYFTKTSANVVSKQNVKNIPQIIESHTKYFIGKLITMLPPNSSPGIVSRLKTYDQTIGKSKSFRIKPPYPPSLKNMAVISPDFVLDNITHATYFQKLFGADPLVLQQDIIKLVPTVKDDVYCHDLKLLLDQIKKDKGPMKSSDFETSQQFKLWYNYEFGELTSLLQTYGGKSVTLDINIPLRIIPNRPRESFVYLLCLILNLESKTDPSSLALSHSASFFMNKCAKYWRIDFETTISTLYYTAANLSRLNNEFFNLELTPNLYNVIFGKFLNAASYDVRYWNRIDKEQWLINYYYTMDQCINSINDAFKRLCSEKRVDYSIPWVFYCNNAKLGNTMDILCEECGDIKRLWSKKLKKTVHEASTQFYFSLLEKVPKGPDIEFQHLQNVAEDIYLKIKSIYTGYKKEHFELLGGIHIPEEVTKVLVQAIVVDVGSMVQQVEKQTKKIKMKKYGPTDALSFYSSVKDLIGLYQDFGITKKLNSIERYFEKYLVELCGTTCSKFLEVITSSLQKEKWEPINAEIRYSYSVVDIFKMLNESLSMFLNFEWGNEYQISKILTMLLKSFSDGLYVYTENVLRLIQVDLNSVESKSTSNEARNTISTQLEEDKASRKFNIWSFNGMKNAINKKEYAPVPDPYEYKIRTCIILNNIEKMKSNLNDLEDRVQPEKITKFINHYEKNHKDLKEIANEQVKKLHHLYTIRIIEAKDIKGFSKSGLSNAMLSLQDMKQRKEISCTKIISKTTNPIWDEEVELMVPYNEKRELLLTVWHHPTSKFKSVGGDEICGKAQLILSKKKFLDDGYPNAVELNLDQQGTLSLQISLETEKMDATFSLGKAYRTLSRTSDRIIELMVSKFSPFIKYSLSRENLMKLHGNSGQEGATESKIGDALLPLFDYLNANLGILSSQLSETLLLAIMSKAWSEILTTADILLLPSLSSSDHKHRLRSARSSIWNSSTLDIVGYGRPLTPLEQATIFMWLSNLGIEFFHNDGQGLPMTEVENAYYQNLKKIPHFYEMSVRDLKAATNDLMTDYVKHLKLIYSNKNYGTSVKRIGTTVERQKTIMANATKLKRQQIREEIQKEQVDPLEQSVEALKIVLRILITKGESDYVHKCVKQQIKEKKQLSLQMKLDAAIQGKIVK